jgi:hypothetical protein
MDSKLAEVILSAHIQEVPTRCGGHLPCNLQHIAKAVVFANAALFIASKESTFITGAEIFADGGAAQV